jgi:hypothetical protein
MALEGVLEEIRARLEERIKRQYFSMFASSRFEVIDHLEQELFRPFGSHSCELFGEFVEAFVEQSEPAQESEGGVFAAASHALDEQVEVLVV